MSMPSETSFGDLLRQHRLAAQLTQAELAERASLSVRGINDLERGARTAPRPETVRLLADALGLQEEERSKFFAAARGTRYSPVGEQIPAQGTVAPSIAGPSLPTGTVTFLFTDIEGSTRLLQRVGHAYAQVLGEHQRLLRRAWAEYGGVEVDTAGDGFFVAFPTAPAAVAAAVAATRALAAHPWPDGSTLRVRMGVHTGAPQLVGDRYVGIDVHRAARIAAAGHGGQILLSASTRVLAASDLPEGATLRELGIYRLKDLQQPESLTQVVLAGLPSDFPPLKTLDRRAHNLPIQPTALLGREDQLATLSALLRREEVRLVTLTGPGGTGKTRLGLQVAADVSEVFPDGVFFVNLAPLSNPELVLPAIAQVLEIRETGERPLLDLLQATLREKHLLLVLDNFEQVVQAAVQVAELLAACPKLKLLVTSRMALHVRAEQEFAVPPLALPDLKHLPDLVALSQYEAVALFIQQAQAVKPAFQVTNATAPAIAEICVRLDGLPLAIELAAARIKLFPPEALLARLGQRLAVLTGGARDVPARQQTLRATIAWSYHLLDAQEQQLFCRLSIFVGGCSVEAVEAVCAVPDTGVGQSVIDQVASLVDKSLVQQTEQEGKEPRFLLLETIREYGLEALAATSELETTRQAHAEYYTHLAGQAEPELVGPQAIAWLERLDREQDNLRATMQWVLEPAHLQRDPERALRLGQALAEFWDVRGLYREGRAFLEQALAANQDAATLLRARVLIRAAGFGMELGDLEQSETLCRESLALSRALGDTRGIIDSLSLLAFIGSWNGDHYGQSRPLMEESLALARELGDTEIIAWRLNELADRLCTLGEYPEGQALFEESLALWRGLGNKRGLADCLKQSAMYLVVDQRDPTTIHDRLEESLTLYQESGDKLGLGFYYFISGHAALAQGDPATARSLYEESLIEASTFQDHWPTAFCLEGLAETVAAQGAAAWAARLCGTAEVERERCGLPLGPFERRDYEAAVAAARLQLGEAAFAAAWAEGRSLTPAQVLARRG